MDVVCSYATISRYLLRSFSCLFPHHHPRSVAAQRCHVSSPTQRARKKAGISAAHQTPEPNKRPKKFQNRVCVCRYLPSVTPRDSSRQSDACGGSMERLAGGDGDGALLLACLLQGNLASLTSLRLLALSRNASRRVYRRRRRLSLLLLLLLGSGE